MSSGIVDVHCHLLDSPFENDVDAVINRAKEAGIAACLVVTQFNYELSPLLDLTNKYPNFVMPCAGIHPVQEIKDSEDFEQRCIRREDIEGLQSFVDEHHEKLVALGEIGLDFMPRICKTDEDKAIQRELLSVQVKLAMKYDLPVNVHSRSAGRHTIALLKELGAKNVLMHAFDGKPSVVREGLDLGYFFSVPPSVLRSDQKSKLVATVPMENLLLETDSPALGPERDMRNEPKNAVLTCEYIAKAKGLSADEVRCITTNNALKLFPKLRNFIK